MQERVFIAFFMWLRLFLSSLFLAEFYIGD